MRIIHTSDWHLGQKFLYQDRIEEHQHALEWLIAQVVAFEVDGLIVAGDIFDIGNPPNYARRMYYQLLTKLRNTPCRHVLIVGGNHDSPAMLDAPKDLLEALNVRVVGAASEAPEDDIIEWHSPDGQLEAVVAAVPFLRDHDIRRSQAGESGMERIAQMKAGIFNHYQKIGKLVEEKYAASAVPKIVTGHLYALGANASAKQNNIYIGDTENIAASDFPAIFDYVALGHIHRAQLIGQQAHIRYSGSIIPLSFSETKDDKSVYLLDFQEGQLKHVEPLAVPTFRRLKTIEGSLEEVEERLWAFGQKDRAGITPWVEMLVHTDKMIPQLDQKIRAVAAKLNVEVLKIKLIHQYQAIDEQIETPELEDIDELEVFRMKCASYGAPPEEVEALVHTFLELKDWLNEKEEA
jgi:exonuclease SbcD